MYHPNSKCDSQGLRPRSLEKTASINNLGIIVGIVHVDALTVHPIPSASSTSYC